MLNNEGKRMLEFCEEYGLMVINGRVRGDKEEKYMHIEKKGASVDYIMMKEGKKITDK